MTREPQPNQNQPAKYHKDQQVWIKGPRHRGPHKIDEVVWINRVPHYELDHSSAKYKEDMLTDIDPNLPTYQTDAPDQNKT